VAVAELVEHLRVNTGVHSMFQSNLAPALVG